MCYNKNYEMGFALMNKSYNEKTAIITGGSRGLGAAIVEEFAKHNYNVVINYNNSKTKANKLKNEIEEKYPVKAIIIKADVSNEEEVIKMMEETVKTFGRIDVLVNNAGICNDSLLEDKTPDMFRTILDTNVVGPFITMKHIGTYMYNEGEGSIVNISSTNGIDTYYPESMDYDASKAGLISLNHNFAKQFAPLVRVNCVAPGWIKTDMSSGLDEEQLEQAYNNILLGRFAEPSEIAESVYFAATASYLNNSVIEVDGGSTE